MDLPSIDCIVSTTPTAGLKRREPEGKRPPRRPVERSEADDLDQDAEEDSPEEETEKHTFDTRA